MSSDDNPKVTKASVEIVADQATFPDLVLLPVNVTAEVVRSVRGSRWWLRWIAQGPVPKVLKFMVRSASRRKT